MVANDSTQKKSFTAIDLFCGSGAVSAGLKAEGFSILAAIDNDPVACQTYKLNHPEVDLHQADILKVDPKIILERIQLNGALDLLVVCAPCQPFSTQNRRKSQDDPRSNLVVESARFITVFKPRVVFFENVPGIARNGPIAELSTLLQKEGYYLSEPLKLNSADLGVPQRRERCIMIASPDKDIARDFGKNIAPLPRNTVRSAIGHLTPLKSGEKCANDPLHRARRHLDITLERLSFIPKNGGSRSSLPQHLQLKCHENRENDFPDVYGRLRWDDVAPTLTTGCTDVTKGRFAHPEDDRALTLREAALLQSFPSSYQFFGSDSDIARQIGNAVPVGMVKCLAPYLKDAVNRYSQKKLSC